MTPYYERNGIAIFCGDCLEVMPGLELEFDAIIADLPFGITACDWDTVIPFEPLWREYKRLIKANGAVVLFGSQPFTSMLVMSNLEWFKHEWIWQKNTGGNFLNVVREPMKEHESVLLFSSGNSTYNRQMQNRSEAGIKRQSSPFQPSALSDNYNNFTPKVVEREVFFRVPSSVQKFNRELGLHPTQKPVSLISYMVRTYTNPGELIIDNAMGSGTTLLAAQNEGRRAIGIEISEEYCKIAVDRLRQPSFFSLSTRGNVEARQLELMPSEEGGLHER